MCAHVHTYTYIKHMEETISFDVASQVTFVSSIVMFTIIINTMQPTVNCSTVPSTISRIMLSTGYQKYLIANVSIDISCTGLWFVSLADTDVTMM